MKKLLSIAMVVVMLFALCATAFADTEPVKTGKITITNATVGKDYAAYKIFDATIKQNADEETEAVAYSISKDNNPYFEYMFGSDGTKENAFFIYEPATGTVRKKAAAVDSELIAYLSNMVTSQHTPDAGPIEATGSTVEFTNVPYGYYLITSTLGTTVTIDSNTPNVSVIDKNQEPGSDFSKLVQNGVDADGNPIWEERTSSAIGDKETYKIQFEATNYDGSNKIKYYQVHDEQGEAIRADFKSFKIVIHDSKTNTDIPLTKGYFLYLGDDTLNPGHTFIGEWAGVAEADRQFKDAEWYLVRTGIDTFRITIPWIEGYSVEEVKDDNGTLVSYKLNVNEENDSIYPSPVTVEIIYQATVEVDATIGGGNNTNLFNKATTTWTCEFESGSTHPDTVLTDVFGFGLLKDDGSTKENLKGAEFEIYKNYDAETKKYSDEVYVIPTDVHGVYILDSEETRSDPRFEDHTAERSNLVVSQVNGKLVVIGLEEGTYYLKEVKAPEGYNALSVPVVIEVDEESTKPFNIFVNPSTGAVADIQQADGIHIEEIFQVTNTTVHNNKGVELPSTGGKGTALLITIGSVVAIGFAVFLITNKKMSVYAD